MSKAWSEIETAPQTDEVVIEATGNCMAVSRVLTSYVKRVVIANPLQVKAIAHAHVKTDKVDAATLANLHAAGHLRDLDTGCGDGADAQACCAPLSGCSASDPDQE